MSTLKMGTRRGAWRALALALLAMFVGLFAGPVGGDAQAATPLPPAVEENFDSVFAFIEAGGLPNGRDRVDCDATCQYLFVKSFPPPSLPLSPAVKQSALKRLGDRLYRLRVAVGELPTPVRVFGVPLALAGANYVAWRNVYKDSKELFLGVEVPAQPTPTITHTRFVEKDTHLLSGQTTPTTVIRASEIGKVGTDASGFPIWADEGTGPCSYYGAIADITFGGFGSIVAGGQCAKYPTGTLTYAVAFQPGVPAHVTPDAQPTSQPPFEWPGSGEGTNGEPADDTRAKAKGALENDPDYGPVIARLDCLLGGDSTDPTGLCIKLPTCRGETFETCQTRLQNAGFTGTMTKRTLSADDAVMEEQPDRVTATSPADGTQTEYDTNITVYVNPDPMPIMTTQQTLIAEALQNNNPQQVNTSNKKSLARQCERYTTARGSGRTAADCMSPTLPIYIIGREWPEAADHTIRGLEYNPAWVALTYKSVARTSWYTSFPETDGGASSCLGTGFVTACDEWPWQKTEQGGPSGVPLPHLKIINFGQNSASGGRFGAFVTTCNLPVRKFNPLYGSGNFLVIPVSKGAPSSTPSLSLCNGPNP